MTGILDLMLGNLSRGPATAPFPGQVAAPEGLRGLVRIAPERCLACGICAYVCPSGAITGAEELLSYEWIYDPGRCTFCARCEDHCPGRALDLAPEPPPSYRTRGQLVARARVAFPACPGCGRTGRILTREWLAGAGGPMDGELRQQLRLCPACRRRKTQEGLKAAMGGVR